ncbi:MAG TPA: hypothetical protein PKL08_00055 [Thermoanaerobaculaceae bacterium]|nr:hypothetical protein [Thermoanaerobaculaceae bacterium]
MTPLSSLWLPVLVSSVIVFVASSLIHMATPWHKSEYPRLPKEDAFREAVGPLGIPPGDYMVPRASSMAEMRAPEFVEKTSQGPVMILTVLPNGGLGMGRSLIGWYLYLVVVTVFAAYVASRALASGAPYLAVFRFVGTTAFVGYSLALWQASIWYARAWSTTARATVDGLVFALLTAGTFGWLWPH